jgi:exodeoxyribonuclease V alpha subunit
MSADLLNLNSAIDSRVIDLVDLESARQIFALANTKHSQMRNDVAVLLAALALRSFRDGHACLDLKNIDAWHGEHNSDLGWPKDPSTWTQALSENSDVFGSPDDLQNVPRVPFIVEDGRIYISRVFQEEVDIAKRLLLNNGSTVTVVLGGPGTGKTRWVAEQLRSMASGTVPSLALCAPTGKASRHLKSVLDKRLREGNASEDVLEALHHAPSTTAHKLLGYHPARTPKFRHGRHEPLPYKLVIVDEASMLSLSMMNRLLSALRPDAELWLVGDPDQLASVEAGSVLADIARGAKQDASILHDRYTELTEQHRFDPNSPIAKLAAAVRDGDFEGAHEILMQPNPDFIWIDPSAEPEKLAKMQAEVLAHARSVLDSAEKGEVENALKKKSLLQVLASTRDGSLGVHDWNQAVEAGLGPVTAQRWYAGRPILVTRNDTSTGLANGDVGVLCNIDGHLRACFGDPQEPTTIALARLPESETVHALTIHKSQGSEYEHVVVVLPQSGSRIVTRELLYTGITRPQKRLTLVATLASIETAIKTPIRRATGLAERL